MQAGKNAGLKLTPGEGEVKDFITEDASLHNPVCQVRPQGMAPDIYVR